MIHQQNGVTITLIHYGRVMHTCSYYWGGGATGLARHLFRLVQQKSKGVRHPTLTLQASRAFATHSAFEPEYSCREIRLQALAIGAVNTETNAKEMSQNRAMAEAGDLNDWCVDLRRC